MTESYRSTDAFWSGASWRLWELDCGVLEDHRTLGDGETVTHWMERPADPNVEINPKFICDLLLPGTRSNAAELPRGMTVYDLADAVNAGLAHLVVEGYFPEYKTGFSEFWLAVRRDAERWRT